MHDRTVRLPSEGESTRAFAPAQEDSTEITRMGGVLPCPACSTSNSAAETWCAECGFRLDAVPGPMDPARIVEGAGTGAALVGEDGTALPLRSGPNRIGRVEGDVVVTHPTVSRLHAVVTIDGGEAWVVDQASSNGTMINGRRLDPGQPHRMAAEDRLRMGDWEATFHVNPCSESPTAAGVPAIPSPDSNATLAADRAPSPTIDPNAPLAPNAVSGSMPHAVDTGVADGDFESADSDGPALVLPSGEKTPLREGTTTIGRKSDSDVVITDPFVSGRHAEVLRESASYHLVDLGSTNGTFRNDRRLAPGERAPLHDGDSVRIGNSSMNVRYQRNDAAPGRR